MWKDINRFFSEKRELRSSKSKLQSHNYNKFSVPYSQIYNADARKL